MPANTDMPAPRRTWRTFAAGLIILLSGVVIGMGLGFRGARLRDPLTQLEPSAVPGRFANLMKLQLGLSSAQRDQLQGIFEKKMVEINGVRAKFYPELEPVFEDLRKQVDGVLSPEQAQRWDEKFRELRERWRPKTPPPASH